MHSTHKRELTTWLDGIVAEGIARKGVEEGDGAAAGAGAAGASGAAGAGGAAQATATTPTTATAGAGAQATAATTAATAATTALMMTANNNGVGGGNGAAAAAGGGGGGGGVFVNHTQEKFVFGEGRRGIRFYLVDSVGRALLAVVGEERETKDGHYSYHKDENFLHGPPLACGNLAGVNQWLRDMCVAGAGAGAGGVGGGVGGEAGGFVGGGAGGGGHPPKLKGNGPGRPKGSGAGAGAGAGGAYGAPGGTAAGVSGGAAGVAGLLGADGLYAGMLGKRRRNAVG